ncbi:hypothetical protein R1flu_011281 [Riccia fluitans]|uniref:Adenosine deaminase domain-containing protein n=1 Tax=Riccia fluitans TaxID=41844 RepID=A0ABD1Z7D5_9MARC
MILGWLLSATVYAFHISGLHPIPGHSDETIYCRGILIPSDSFVYSTKPATVNSSDCRERIRENPDVKARKSADDPAFPECGSLFRAANQSKYEIIWIAVTRYRTIAITSHDTSVAHYGGVGYDFNTEGHEPAPVAVRMATFNAMPKLELHAHLNGCVRSSTLLELYLERGCEGRISNSDLECLILKEDRSLTECFRLFPVIHALTTDHAIVKRITKEAIEDFIRDNVVYLELRTTPKSNEAYGMSKRSYVEAVLAGFEAAEVSYNTKEEDSRSKHLMQVRLLLSIDRRESTEEAMETVELAWELRCRGVVGIDLSGDPVIGTWKTFLPALMRAKQLGVPLTLHCGEVPNSEEVRAMIALKPNRLGHVCCLEEEEWKYLLDSGIPVEVCLTSNVSTESVPSVTDHHFGLSEIELLLIAKSAVNYTFADDMTKLALHRIFDDALEKMQGVKSTSEG